jgi:hypothetical protein
VEKRIEGVFEFPDIVYKKFPLMDEYKPRRWNIKGDMIPLTFSLKAAKN